LTILFFCVIVLLKLEDLNIDNQIWPSFSWDFYVFFLGLLC